MWRVGTVAALRDQTATARTITLDVLGWPGQIAGQHVDLRLTAADGYSTVRLYSITSVPNSGRGVELTIERLLGGEVSPHFTRELAVGDPLELRGPIGAWCMWRNQQTEPIQLVAGGSGIVPLMAMVRSRASSGSTAPFRLLCSLRERGGCLYREELEALSKPSQVSPVTVEYVYTRAVPADYLQPPGRIDGALIARTSWASSLAPTCYGLRSYIVRRKRCKSSDRIRS